VREYLTLALEPGKIILRELADGRYVAVQPSEDGMLRSRIFPGLWLDPVTLLEGDGAGLLAALNKGLASPEHQAFVEKLDQSNRF
jgi:hypothetical protein